MSEQDLDTRIRSLVARAVADAPAAPELDPATVLEGRCHDRERDRHRGWWVGGGAALLAAAAAITTVVLVADTDDRISTPADTTLPAVATTVPPTAPATVVPPSTLPAQPDPTVPVVVPRRRRRRPRSPPVTPIVGEDVATAGPDGVVLRTGRRRPSCAGSTSPAAIALPVGDGRVVVELARRTPTRPRSSSGTPTARRRTPFPPIDAGGRDHHPGRRHRRRPSAAAVRRRPAPRHAATCCTPDRSTFDWLDERSRAARRAVGGCELVPQPAAPRHQRPRRRRRRPAAVLQPVRRGAARDRRPRTSSPRSLTGCARPRGLVDCRRRLRPRARGRLQRRQRRRPVGWVEGDRPRGRRPRARSRRARRRPSADAVESGPSTSTSPATARSFSYGPFGDRAADAPRPGPPRSRSRATRPTVGPTTLPTDLGDAGHARPPTRPAGSSPPAPTASPCSRTASRCAASTSRPRSPSRTPGGAVIFQPARPTPDGEPGDPLIWRPDGTVERAARRAPASGSRTGSTTSPTSAASRRCCTASRTRAPARARDGRHRASTEVLHALTMTPGGWTRCRARRDARRGRAAVPARRSAADGPRRRRAVRARRATTCTRRSCPGSPAAATGSARGRAARARLRRTATRTAPRLRASRRRHDRRLDSWHRRSWSHTSRRAPSGLWTCPALDRRRRPRRSTSDVDDDGRRSSSASTRAGRRPADVVHAAPDGVVTPQPTAPSPRSPP